mmetsp:Transcript_41027/g.102008  ORF Transcript_41027/g.102008 Transcript_41027/m.102008 type:complete len:91 (+) Transcript_41027:260-532(+)
MASLERDVIDRLKDLATGASGNNTSHFPTIRPRHCPTALDLRNSERLKVKDRKVCSHSSDGDELREVKEHVIPVHDIARVFGRPQDLCGK